MRTFMVPVAAALSLVALPALAASVGGTSNSSSTSNGSPQSSMEIQQDLQQSLTQAGFTDINIVPGSFLVRAKDKKGHPVEMMINPNSVVEISSIPVPNANMSGPQNGSTATRQTK